MSSDRGARPEPAIGDHVSIEFLDSVVASEGWSTPAELAEVADSMIEHRVAGYVAATTGLTIVVCSAYSKPTGNGAGCVAVPRLAITALRIIEAPR